MDADVGFDRGRGGCMRTGRDELAGEVAWPDPLFAAAAAPGAGELRVLRVSPAVLGLRSNCDRCNQAVGSSMAHSCGCVRVGVVLELGELPLVREPGSENERPMGWSRRGRQGDVR